MIYVLLYTQPCSNIIFGNKASLTLSSLSRIRSGFPKLRVLEEYSYKQPSPNLSMSKKCLSLQYLSLWILIFVSYFIWIFLLPLNNLKKNNACITPITLVSRQKLEFYLINKTTIN